MTKPRIFLDFDGVLNSLASLKRHGKLILAPEHIDVLNEIIRQTGAEVVVSSSWRLDMSVRQLKDMLKRKGVIARVIDKTPELSKVTDSGLWTGNERGHEIQAWLDTHDHELFAIIDDEDDMAHLKPYLVQTNFDTGLTMEHVGPAVKLLTQVYR